MDAGIPIPVPNFTVAKACGGSLKSVFLAAQAIKAGDAQVLVAGGLEHMSNAGYLLTKPAGATGWATGSSWTNWSCSIPSAATPLGETAENVAEKYQI